MRALQPLHRVVCRNHRSSAPNFYLYTLGSDAVAMPARFRRLSVFGWLIVALAAVSVETHAQDLEPRAFANTPVGTQLLDRRVCVFERHCGHGPVGATGRYRGYA